MLRIAERQQAYTPTIDAIRQQLRMGVIEEDRLRRQVSADERTRQTSPDVWRQLESRRVESNREKAALNERLASLGLAPVPLRPSLAEERRILKRLQRANAATIATLQREFRKMPAKAAGTPLARTRLRQSAKEARK